MIESFSKIFKRARSGSSSKSSSSDTPSSSSSSSSSPLLGYNKNGYDDLKLPEIERTEFYFSYGSNMLPTHLKKCKDIQPYSIRRGIINGWRLSFSCCITTNKSDPCFANIVPHTIDDMDDSKDNKDTLQTSDDGHPYVHGCIIEVNPAVFEKLDGYEFTYVRKQVEATIYDEDGGGTLNVWTYIMDKKHEMYLNKKYPQQKYEFIEKPPSKNYLDILIEGATAIKLYNDYIQYLKSTKFQKYLTLQPKDKIIKKINGTVFTMKDIKNWNNDKYLKNRLKIDKNNRIKGPLMVLKGVVFDLNKSPKYFQTSYGANDITLKQGSRWVYANKKNTKSISSLEDDQKLFINHVLMGALMGGSILGNCIGKLSKKDKYGYHYYKW